MRVESVDCGQGGVLKAQLHLVVGAGIADPEANLLAVGGRDGALRIRARGAGARAGDDGGEGGH